MRHANARSLKEIRDRSRAHLPWVLAAVEAADSSERVDILLFSTRVAMQASGGGAYSLNNGYVDLPECAGVVRQISGGTYRAGADASCSDRGIVRPDSHRLGYPAAITDLAPRDAVTVRDLATRIRSYAAAVYIRKRPDSQRKAASYLREYEDIPRWVSICAREYVDRAPRFAVHMRKRVDVSCITPDCDIKRKSASLSYLPHRGIRGWWCAHLLRTSRSSVSDPRAPTKGSSWSGLLYLHLKESHK